MNYIKFLFLYDWTKSRLSNWTDSYVDFLLNYLIIRFSITRMSCFNESNNSVEYLNWIFTNKFLRNYFSNSISKKNNI